MAFPFKLLDRYSIPRDCRFKSINILMDSLQIDLNYDSIGIFNPKKTGLEVVFCMMAPSEVSFSFIMPLNPIRRISSKIIYRLFPATLNSFLFLLSLEQQLPLIPVNSQE